MLRWDEVVSAETNPSQAIYAFVNFTYRLLRLEHSF